MRRAGKVLAGRGAAPLRRLRRHLPLQGRLWRFAAGEGAEAGMARKGGRCGGAYCKSTQAVVCGVVTQGCCGGRERPPYIVAGNGQRRISGSLPRGLAAGRCKASAPTQVCAGGPARFCVVHNRVFLGVGSGRDGEIWNLLKRKKYGIIFGDYPNLKVGKNAYIINSINK